MRFSEGVCMHTEVWAHVRVNVCVCTHVYV